MKLARNILAAFAALILLSTVAAAQVPSAVGPFNVTLTTNGVNGVIANAGRGTGTINSATYINYDQKGLVCTHNITGESGSPTVAWSIQQQDAASGTWLTLQTNTVTMSGLAQNQNGNPVQSVIEIYPGIATSSLPSVQGGTFVGVNLHLPRVFRLTQTISGSATPTLTSTVGCDILQ